MPVFYEGTLIKLESKDLTELVRVLYNLKTKTVIFFSEDSNIAEELKQFNLVEVDIV